MDRPSRVLKQQRKAFFNLQCKYLRLGGGGGGQWRSLSNPLLCVVVVREREELSSVL